MKRTHKLKIDSCYHAQIHAGNKTAELRMNDRDYQKGDRLLFGQNKDLYEITHILSNFPDGLMPGYVVLSFKKLTPRTEGGEDES